MVSDDTLCPSTLGFDSPVPLLGKHISNLRGRGPRPALTLSTKKRRGVEPIPALPKLGIFL